MLYFFEDPSTAKGMARVSCLILHASVHFPCSEDLLAVGKSNAHAAVNRVVIFALKRQNIGQKRFNTLVHRVHCLALVDDNSKSPNCGRALTVVGWLWRAVRTNSY